MQKTRIMKEISPEWDRLMQLATKVKYGEAKIIFQNGKPKRLQFVMQDIDLENEDRFKQGCEIILL